MRIFSGLALCGALLAVSACDFVDAVAGSAVDYPVVEINVGGDIYRAEDRAGVNLPPGEPIGRYRVALGGGSSIYCGTIAECQGEIREVRRRSRETLPPINPPTTGTASH